ncbi:Fur family zinc uptake transcriptional regulator [Virgibacillus natechei]|uniref:Fur family zinc uptake transcriptional regulator n=1 Tax=Virgibacillus natechei TaxID=1216297 RepID=A0ABS4IEY2_9BACI|nr:Fur family transcriptional regulator [Virgibacillus natechei]MBP1969492.1 Fur family zinc uptake transcriptional regulator [Virgibacillus natechei]UZD11804.1 transcriptional repressor [Virgibacillus natechei]
MNLNEAIDLLKEKGYKTTGKRKDILTYFEKADGYRTAKDLIQYMELSHEGISFDTVYRNLHLYDKVGILETTELNGEKQFRMNCTDHHHHHFICNDCGKTKPLEVCPMDDIENKLANYAIEGHKFEIYGLCPGCISA